MENTVFLASEGLTSTSANASANMAKEAYLRLEEQLARVSFVNQTATLIGGDKIVTKKGITPEDLAAIPELYKQMGKLKTLIAWLREAIKEKDYQTNTIRHENVCAFVDIPEEEPFEEEAPERPSQPSAVSAESVLATWPIERRVRYESLKTQVANIGKGIHPNGIYSDARKEAVNAMARPNSVQGSGRDLVVYTNSRSCTTAEVDSMFFQLQDMHRTLQKELNAMQHELELSAQEQNDAAQKQYVSDLEAFQTAYRAWSDRRLQFIADQRNQRETLVAQAEEIRAAKLHEIQALKIVIPDSLKETYKLVQNLGK